MTKRELTAAQMALQAWESSYRLADEFDPERKVTSPGSETAMWLAQFGVNAGRLFFNLTGRLPQHATMTDLSTDTPAEWTQRPKRKRFQVG
jgi:hypothetical protein